MSPVVLGSAIGAASLAVGRGVATATASGLSFGAALLRAATGDSPEPSENQAASGSGLPAELKQRITELTDRIRRQLAAAGIRLTQPLELTSDGAGGIAVGGFHPQQSAINDVLSSDLLLERDFTQLAGDYAEFAAGQNGSELPPALNIVLGPPA
jgi:hypothetical protein